MDLENAIQELVKGRSEEQELEVNKLPLKEINLNCNLFQDPASRKYTKTIINLNGCVDDGVDYSCKSKSNLNGNINIKIFGLRDKYPTEYYKIFEKGKLLAEINGPINSVMSLKKTGDVGIFGGTSIIYQTEITPQKITASNVEYINYDKKEDEYGRKYSRVPFIINAKFVDNNGKEYLYNGNAYYDPTGFHECEIVSEITS